IDGHRAIRLFVPRGRTAGDAERADHPHAHHVPTLALGVEREPAQVRVLQGCDAQAPRIVPATASASSCGRPPRAEGSGTIAAMRLVACLAVVCACHGSDHVTTDAPAPGDDDAAIDAPANIDHWKQVFDEVDGTHLQQLVTDMAHERYDAAGRMQFRTYWT